MVTVVVEAVLGDVLQYSVSVSGDLCVCMFEYLCIYYYKIICLDYIIYYYLTLRVHASVSDGWCVCVCLSLDVVI